MRDQHGPDHGSDRSPGSSAPQRDTDVPGKRTLVEAAFARGDAPVQRRATEAAGQDSAGVHSAAQRGLTGATGPLPHAETIQRLFGRHDISNVRSQVGGPAAEACRDMGAQAYASQGRVAFAQTPDLHTAAHEAAHVVQQRADVQLKGGIGEVHDRYEQHADAVADRVVHGESAEHLLDEHASATSERGTSIRGDACPGCGAARTGAECENCTARSGAIQRQAAPDPGAAARGACRETVDRHAGPQHEAIQAHYKASIDPTGLREFAIPGSSRAGNIGYADIVSMGTGAIYEIKPYIPSEIEDGLEQVGRYLKGARASCGVPPPWHLGVSYPDSVIPFGDKQLVAKQYGHPGLIIYWDRNKPKQPDYQQLLSILIALGIAIALLPVIAAALADPEPVTKLTLAGLSAVMIATLLDKLGMADQAGPPST
jgi:hypothetical protein